MAIPPPALDNRLPGDTNTGAGVTVLGSDGSAQRNHVRAARVANGGGEGSNGHGLAPFGVGVGWILTIQSQTDLPFKSANKSSTLVLGARPPRGARPFGDGAGGGNTGFGSQC